MNQPRNTIWTLDDSKGLQELRNESRLSSTDSQRSILDLTIRTGIRIETVPLKIHHRNSIEIIHLQFALGKNVRPLFVDWRENKLFSASGSPTWLQNTLLPQVPFSDVQP